ncbi:PAS domain S-box protein [Lacinutrix undariae]
MDNTNSDFDRSTHLLNLIEESVQVGTWEVDIKTMDTTWSKATYEIHEVEENIKPSFDDAINYYKDPKSLQILTEAFTACIEEGKRFDLELELTTAKGNKKWVRAVGVSDFKFGKCIKVSGVFQDITEKTRTLQTIALREEELRKTFEYAGNGMAIVDLDGSWVKVNQKLCAMFGYTEKEFLQKTFKDMTYHEDIESSNILVNSLLNLEIENKQMEKRYVHKNGDIIWTLLNTSVIKNDDGTVRHLVSQISDITLMKKAEERISALHKVTKEQNDRLLNFAHIVSHNLRSHSGNLEMLLDLMKYEVPEATENSFFPLIGDAVNSLSETVSNLNEVAILNTQIHKELTEVSLHTIVEKAIGNVKGTILETHAVVNNEVAESLKLKTVPAYLDSIILNFLTNALKYKKETEAPIINLRANFSKDKEFIILDIEDNGMGIDLERHGKKLFGMYKTFHKHKDSRGLGLFITKNQIEAIGGHIEVKSKINVGTTFSLYLKHEKN